MTKFADRNFVRTINKETGEETYKIQFDYGVQAIKVKEGSKIILDFVHGGFEKYFTREGNNLIIGDDMYLYMAEPLGVGHGKEVWTVIEGEASTYNITISKYHWAGSNYGYADNLYKSETMTMTEAEYVEFQSKNEVSLNVGQNTLYTTWAVLPNPVINYHMEDYGYYAPANGKIILKDYFLYGKDSVYVGEELLTDIIKSSPQFSALVNANSKKPYNLYDSFFDDNLYGGDRADKIHSYMSDDLIEAGRGNDKIYLGEGNKTIVISQGEGKDTVYNFEKSDSVKFEFDTDNIYYTKSKNNLVINRSYDEKTEQTVVNNYFKNYDKDNKIVVSNGDIELVSDFTKELTEGNVYLSVSGNKKINGTNYSDEAFSSKKNETFSLGTGNDIIRFRANGMFSVSPYEFGKDVVKLVKGSHVTLDFDGVGGSFFYEKKGDDAVITARYQVELCGRDNGKEEWTVKMVKGGYNITKTKYCFNGNGYKETGDVSEVTMTKSEFKSFQKENGVKLKVGSNTLYTSWAVVPEPVIHYSMKDSANWGAFWGSVTLKDYFKYNEDSVYIGETSLREYFKNMVMTIDKSKSKSGQTISDTLYNEVITGSKYGDKITSYKGDDTINAGKGNDIMVLSDGNKTININKADGTDLLMIYKSTESVNIVFDQVDSVSFDRLDNNLVITRGYDDGFEGRTVIQNYYRNNLKNDITVSSPEFSQKLSEDVTGLTWSIICRYPPIDTPVVEAPKDEGHWEIICAYPPFDEPVVAEPVLICGYPPCDKVETVEPILQDVSAWQTSSSEPVMDSYLQTVNSDIIPVLAQGGV